MADIRQSPEYAHYLRSSGWIVERIKNVNYFIRRLPLIGSIIKVQRPELLDNKSISQLVSKYRAFQIIFEPKDLIDSKSLIANRYRFSKSPYLPTKTLYLDLRQTKSELFKSLAKDAKSALKKTMNDELLAISSVEDFRQHWKKAVSFKRYVPSLNNLISLKKSFGKNCVFVSCYHDSNHSSFRKINAGAIFLVAGKTGYYWQAFTDKAGRKSQVQYKIVWEGILWAKKMGARTFDFEGVYDERFPNKSWLGFTHFKKSFGGKEIEYPGTYVKTRFPI